METRTDAGIFTERRLTMEVRWGAATERVGEIVTREIKRGFDEFYFATRHLESNLPHGGVKYIRGSLPFIIMSAIVETEVIQELKTIKRDLEYIKLHMVDIDVILTPEEDKILEEGLEEFEAGKTISLSDLKRDRREI